MTGLFSKAARLTIVSVALGLGACGGGDTSVAPPVATSVSANSSTSLTAVGGASVPELPSVIVKDQRGAAMAGVLVTFAVTSGGGTITGSSVTTNASGVATVGGWTLGAVAGSNSLTASSSGLTPVTFTANGTAGAAASAVKTAGDAQIAAAGSAVSTAPAVTVRDANGNPVSGVTVVFAVASGGGSVTGGTQTTNTAGVATFGGWTLGTTAGANTLTASAGSLPAVTFTATGTAGAAASVVKTAGDAQTATAGSVVSTAPAVTVRDANGNPVSGVTVVFAVASGGGSVTGGTQTTNSAGVATVGAWTLGPGGANTLRATAGSLSALTFTATGVTGVGGIINTNTTWALANSPYRLTSDVQIAYGAVLTIEPGVTVQGENRRIAVFGALNAVGTALSRISFYDTRITPGANRELEPFTIVIEYADLNRGSFYAPTGNAIYGSFTLRNSVIRDASEYMYVWYPVADTYIERNIFINSGGISIGADLRTTAKYVYVRNNSFQGWTAPNGKYFAVVNWASYGGEAVVLKYNSFLSTDRVAVQVETDGQLNATENYWNTVNEVVIQSMIFDKNDDLAAPGFVEYRPFLTQRDPNTPSN